MHTDPLTGALLPAAPLRRVCAWCGKIMQDGPSEFVTHTICTPCAAGSGVFDVEDLHGLSPEALDTLPWGTVGLDDEGRVLAYNASEERIAHRSRASTMGRLFFREVAPCTSVAGFEGRYQRMVATRTTTPEHFEFVFRFPGAELLVEIAMSYSPERRRGTLLIRAVDD
jgi:photoactive yellow protein